MAKLKYTSAVQAYYYYLFPVSNELFVLFINIFISFIKMIFVFCYFLCFLGLVKFNSHKLALYYWGKARVLRVRSNLVVGLVRFSITDSYFK